MEPIRRSYSRGLDMLPSAHWNATPDRDLKLLPATSPSMIRPDGDAKRDMPPSTCFTWARLLKERLVTLSADETRA